MSLEYIRKTYNVPAFRGTRVRIYRQPGVITGSYGAYLRVVLDGEKRRRKYHPTDQVEYLGIPAKQAKGER